MSFTASIAPSFRVALAEWDRLAVRGDVLPFQRSGWLAAWERTMGARAEIELLPISLRDARGVLVAGLPLVRETRRLKRIGFVDGGLADYNAPILGPGAPADADAARRAWEAVLRVLPPADVVRLERMPRVVGHRPNPLALLPGARASTMLGLTVSMEIGFDDWRAGRPRRYRMEIGRCARLFHALPEAVFEQVAAADAAQALLDLERLQRKRFEPRATPYQLDDPHVRAFHARLGIETDASFLFVLRAEGRVLAVLYGLRDGRHVILLRVAADEDYAHLSPARLVIVLAMERLAAEGVGTVDLGLGDYPYKRRLGGCPVALVDLVAARSVRGLAELVEYRAAATLRAWPRAHAAARRMRDALPPRFRPTPRP